MNADTVKPHDRPFAVISRAGYKIVFATAKNLLKGCELMSHAPASKHSTSRPVTAGVRTPALTAEHESGRAKRISRPEHWRHAAPLAVPSTTISSVQHAAIEPATQANPEWREDSGFLMRALALLALANFLLFMLFPIHAPDHAQMSETYTPITDSAAMPPSTAKAAHNLTLYAPAPRSPEQRKPATTPRRSADVPAWVRE
jgi:hypothetical protein